jgi:hypothetical protein
VEHTRQMILVKQPECKKRLTILSISTVYEIVGSLVDIVRYIAISG